MSADSAETPQAATQDFDSGSEFVRLEIADQIATIRLDRPKLNPLNRQVQAAIGRCADEADRRADVAAVVVTGGEKVFAAGADIKEMASMEMADMVDSGRGLQQSLTRVAEIGKPVVAAINGYALGGGLELALCADVRFAAEDATVGQPEINLGVIPGAGGTQRLTRLVGPSRAKDLIFTGRHVKAEEALQIGLVDRVLPADQVQQAARDWAAQFVGGPAQALRAAKEAVDFGGEVDLQTGLQIERQLFARLFGTADQKAGMEAFTKKEKPRFTGR